MLSLSDMTKRYREQAADHEHWFTLPELMDTAASLIDKNVLPRSFSKMMLLSMMNMIMWTDEETKCPKKSQEMMKMPILPVDDRRINVGTRSQSEQSKDYFQSPLAKIVIEGYRVNRALAVEFIRKNCHEEGCQVFQQSMQRALHRV